MKKILITGASGFIGSFLVEKALDEGMEVWAGIRSTSSREYLSDARIRFIDLNYSDKEKLTAQLKSHKQENGKWDYVIHNLGVTKCLDYADFEKINFGYTKCLIEALAEAAMIPEKFLLMSSLSVYPVPETIYAKSKLKAEIFLKAQSGFPYVILRPTGVYGPRDMDYLLMMKSIKAGIDVAAGLETQRLTFIYVKDLAKAAFLALNSKWTNKTWFVSDGDEYSDKEYSEIVKHAMDKRFVLRVRIPLPVLKAISAGAELVSKITKKPSTLNNDKYLIMKRRNWTCDVLPLWNDLGFTPDYDLKRGVEEALQWYRGKGLL
ncbi:MAG: NAD(P)-dependent oxidoreductase [Dysgonamonadaceae bacterium]|jgi:nucleoside-diphosphate-sugar epimerase|nr:NAD(P)-dependent oxidoreductase [Dysgonamonadaceae bacterium]